MKPSSVIRLLFLLLAGWLSVGCCRHSHDEEQTVDRTVLIFMAANNDLYGDALGDIRQILHNTDWETLGKGKLLVFFSGQPDHNHNPGGQRLWRISPSKNLKKSTADTVLLQTYHFENPLEPAAMRQIIAEALHLAPAEHYGLVLWSHSTGWIPKDLEMTSGESRLRAAPDNDLRTKWFGAEAKTDGTNSYHHMDYSELAAVLENFGWDYIIADACLCASVETAYDLRRAADFLVGSPTEVLSEGFPYDRMLPLLFTGRTARQISFDVAESFLSYYRDEYMFSGRYCPYATITVADLSQMDSLACAARPLLARMKKDSLSTQDVQVYDGRRNSLFFDFDSFVRENVALSEDDPQYRDFRIQLEKTVPYLGHTDFFYSTMSGGGVSIRVKEYCGLATFIPRYGSEDNLLEHCSLAYPATAWAQAVGF